MENSSTKYEGTNNNQLKRKSRVSGRYYNNRQNIAYEYYRNVVKQRYF